MGARITKLANVIIPAADQDRALQFYTEGSRWIEVVPPGGDTPTAICPPGPTSPRATSRPASPYRPRTPKSATSATPSHPCSGSDPEGNTLQVVQGR
ncbi:MAG: hypothetical protein M3065_19240 [Actinomycetota bacterium]|nr:hypothetical protein [Actinomycetota bacterium]